MRTSTNTGNLHLWSHWSSCAMLVISLMSCSSSYNTLNIRFTLKFSGAITSGTEVPKLRTIVSGYPSEYSVRDSVRPCLHPANCQICRIRTTCPPRDTQWLSHSRSSPLRDYSHPISWPSGKFPTMSRLCQSTMLLSLCHWPIFSSISIQIPLISYLLVAPPERSGLCSICPQGRVHSP